MTFVFTQRVPVMSRYIVQSQLVFNSSLHLGDYFCIFNWSVIKKKSSTILRFFVFFFHVLSSPRNVLYNFGLVKSCIVLWNTLRQKDLGILLFKFKMTRSSIECEISLTMMKITWVLYSRCCLVWVVITVQSYCSIQLFIKSVGMKWLILFSQRK